MTYVYLNTPTDSLCVVPRYVVLSGDSLWRHGDEGFQARPGGSYVFHPSQQHHAMQTLEEPLLALWAWTGDIVTDADWVVKPAKL